MLTYSIVIPTMNRPDQVVATIRTILELTRLPERIVIVDASTPPLELGEPLAREIDRAGVDLVVAHSEPSTARQRNLGVGLVDTPTVMFLDDDVHLEPAYAETLLGRWERAGLDAYGGMVGSPAVVHAQSPAVRFGRYLLMLNYHSLHAPATKFRRSQKLRFVPRPEHEVVVPAAGAGGSIFRTDLLRRHPFDERFQGYALGEDLDMSARLAADAPIIQSPAVRFTHHWEPRERKSKLRWHHRANSDLYFRLRRLEHTPLSLASFAISLTAEAALAAIDSLRERDPRYVKDFIGGAGRTIVRVRREGRDP